MAKLLFDYFYLTEGINKAIGGVYTHSLISLVCGVGFMCAILGTNL